MSSDLQADQESYRLIVTRRGATELLLHANGPSRCLPQVGVRSGERLAVQLTQAVRNNFGLEAYCLFVPAFCRTPDAARERRYAVMESVEQNGSAPARARVGCPPVPPVERPPCPAMKRMASRVRSNR